MSPISCERFLHIPAPQASGSFLRILTPDTIDKSTWQDPKKSWKGDDKHGVVVLTPGVRETSHHLTGSPFLDCEPVKRPWRSGSVGRSFV